MGSKKYNIMEHYFCPTVILATVLILIGLVTYQNTARNGHMMGGKTSNQGAYSRNTQSSGSTSTIGWGDHNRKYVRPSNQPLVTRTFQIGNEGEGIPKIFNSPLEVVEAFFGVISEAANLDGYAGTYAGIAEAKRPYTFAYEMFSAGMKNSMPNQRFLNSFKGVGHVGLLKLHEMNKIVGSGTHYPRYFVEIETIEASKEKDVSYFGYYYGEVVTENCGSIGWKIRNMNLIGENFLPYANSGWRSDALVNAKAKFQISTIKSINDTGTIKEVIGQTGDGKVYKLVLTRLTNGSEVLIRSLIQTGTDSWEEVPMK